MGWPASVLAHYKLEIDATDDVGGFNGTNNASTTYTTDGGQYCVYGNSDGAAGAIDLPTGLWTALGATDNWSIQMKVKPFASITGNGWMTLCAIPAGGATGLGFLVRADYAWSVIYATSTFSVMGATWVKHDTAWDLMSIEYNGTADTVKIYQNGSLIVTVTGQANRFATGRTTEIFSLLRSQYGDWGGKIKIHDVVFANTVQTGVEIVPTPDGKAGIRTGFNVGGNSRIKIGGSI